MKKLFLLAWPIALAAVSCSNEEVVSVNNDANEIKFTAVVNKATRAADSYCNDAMPADFNVWARVGTGENTKQYFENVLYKKQSGITYEAADGEVHFWPTEGTNVSFWAAKNHTVGGTFNWTKTGTTAPTIKFAPKLNASEQVDLLYAYTVQSRPTYGADASGQNGAKGIVPMNFRHALSQVVFRAAIPADQKTIKVQIDKVEICRINAEGVFSYPTNATDDNYEKHDNGTFAEVANTIGTWGTWTETGEGAAKHIVTANYTTGDFDAVTIASGENKNLTDETTEHNAAASRKFSHTLMLLPQQTAKWAHTAGTTGTGVNTAPNNKGAYFLVYCKIWNVSGATSTDEVQLWGDTNTKAVAIPVDINWAPGRKYIYTFTFGKSTTGGFDPTTGEDVLIPISFNVTVDDFVNVTNPAISVPMEQQP